MSSDVHATNEPTIEQVTYDVARITIDCVRPSCDGEISVKFYGPASEYTLRDTCPRCATPYAAEEEEAAIAIAKDFYENVDPTPYCTGCGAMYAADCDCGPIARDH